MTNCDLPVFRQRLLDQLSEVVAQRSSASVAPVTSAARPQRRRHLVYKAAAIALVAAGVLVAVESRRSDPAGASFALTQGSDGVIEITFDDDFDDGAALQNELREAGIDVDITSVPASPSLVGRVDYLIGTSDTFPQPGIEQSGLSMTIDPAQLDGPIAMSIGVAADTYQWQASAFDSREALDGLQCALPSPLNAGDIAPYLDQLDLDAEWTVLTPIPNRDWVEPDPNAEGSPPKWLIDAEDVTTPPANALVLHANSASTSLIRVEVLDPDVEQPPVPEWEPDFGTAPCTPERANRWQT